MATFSRRQLVQTLAAAAAGLAAAPPVWAAGLPEDRVKVCDQYRNIMGYGDGVMAGLYSAMDVLSSATMGEGFGVPIIEAQACGTPVIVGGWTAMPELLGAGWTVTAHERVLTPMQAYQYLPTCDGVLEALEASYAHRGDASLRAQARAFAMRYDADEVTQQYWKPALESMADEIGGEAAAEAPPVEVMS